MDIKTGHRYRYHIITEANGYLQFLLSPYIIANEVLMATLTIEKKYNGLSGKGNMEHGKKYLLV